MRAQDCRVSVSVCSVGQQSHRWHRRGDMGGAGVPVPRGAAGQELSSCDGARQTRQGIPKTGLQVRQAPVTGPQGRSDLSIPPCQKLLKMNQVGCFLR